MTLTCVVMNYEKNKILLCLIRLPVVVFCFLSALQARVLKDFSGIRRLSLTKNKNCNFPGKRTCHFCDLIGNIIRLILRLQYSIYAEY